MGVRPADSSRSYSTYVYRGGLLSRFDIFMAYLSHRRCIVVCVRARARGHTAETCEVHCLSHWSVDRAKTAEVSGTENAYNDDNNNINISHYYIGRLSTNKSSTTSHSAIVHKYNIRSANDTLYTCRTTLIYLGKYNRGVGIVRWCNTIGGKLVVGIIEFDYVTYTAEFWIFTVASNKLCHMSFFHSSLRF